MLIRIHDQGIGISEKRLAEINARLSAPSSLSSAAAGSMGLHVVAHLAARHHIQVSLYSTGNGTVACIEVPEAVLTLVEKALSRQSPALSRQSPAIPATPVTTAAGGRSRPAAPVAVAASKAWFGKRTGPAPTAPARPTAAPAIGQPATAAQLVWAAQAPTVALPTLGSARQATPAGGPVWQPAAPAMPDRPRPTSGNGSPPLWQPSAPAAGGQELPRRVRGGQLAPELPTAQSPVRNGTTRWTRSWSGPGSPH